MSIEINNESGIEVDEQALLRLSTFALDFLHHVAVDMTGLQKADAVFQTHPFAPDGRKFLLLDRKFGIDVRVGTVAPRAADGVVAEIGDDGRADRRDDRRAEKPEHASPDSHPANESHTDSAGQVKSEVQATVL